MSKSKSVGAFAATPTGGDISTGRALSNSSALIGVSEPENDAWISPALCPKQSTSVNTNMAFKTLSSSSGGGGGAPAPPPGAGSEGDGGGAPAPPPGAGAIASRKALSEPWVSRCPRIRVTPCHEVRIASSDSLRFAGKPEVSAQFVAKSKRRRSISLSCALRRLHFCAFNMFSCNRSCRGIADRGRPVFGMMVPESIPKIVTSEIKSELDTKY